MTDLALRAALVALLVACTALALPVIGKALSNAAHAAVQHGSHQYERH